MKTERRNQILLGALVVVLAIVGYRTWSATSRATPGPSNGRGAAGQGARGGAGAAPVAAPDVHLQALNSQRAKPVAGERNLFTFKPKVAPAPAPGPREGAPQGPVNPAPPAPTGPPPPPPIALKFIGVVEQGANRPKIALLSDSAGHVFQGVEGGPPIEGRYLILRIGAESIEMSYLDGRGRQTIRLNGS